MNFKGFSEEQTSWGSESFSDDLLNTTVSFIQLA
jgi:hypothetical protein